MKGIRSRAMAEGLPQDEREIFAKGLINLIIMRYPPAQGVKGLQLFQLMQPAASAAHVTLDGITRSEILERGRELAERAEANAAAKDEPKVDPKAPLRECIRELVTLSGIRVEDLNSQRIIKMDVTNNLSWAISGVRVSYRIMLEGRSVPWDRDDFAISISGGVEPGETRTILTRVNRIPAEAPSDLIASAEVLDVADPEFRQLIQDVKVIGDNWAEGVSERPCE